MTVTPQFVSWLRAELSQRGWDVAELARRTKLHHTAWGRLLSGLTMAMSAKTVSALSEVFSVSELELYQIANPKNHELLHVRNEEPPPAEVDGVLRFLFDHYRSDPVARARIEGLAMGMGYVVPLPGATRYDHPKKKEHDHEKKT